MGEESTGGMVIPPGITGSKTRNLPDECYFSGQGPAIHRKNGYSIGNFQLVEEKSKFT
jgi:hypothetical protein